MWDLFRQPSFGRYMYASHTTESVIWMTVGWRQVKNMNRWEILFFFLWHHMESESSKWTITSTLYVINTGRLFSSLKDSHSLTPLMQTSPLNYTENSSSAQLIIPFIHSRVSVCGDEGGVASPRMQTTHFIELEKRGPRLASPGLHYFCRAHLPSPPPSSLLLGPLPPAPPQATCRKVE